MKQQKRKQKWTRWTERNSLKRNIAQGWQHWGAGGHGPPTFLHSKRKKRETKEKKSFRAGTIKRLSPRSKCYCFNHSRVSQIQKCSFLSNHGGRQYFSVFHGPSTLESISSALEQKGNCLEQREQVEIYHAWCN